MKLHPVDELFEILEKQVKPFYPDEVVGVPELVSGFTFFPGDGGLYGRVALKTPVKWPDLKPKPNMPINGVMILGHNLYDLEGYWGNFEATRMNGETPSKTWLYLKPSLHTANVPLEKCFFTNAYMGLMVRDKKNSTGEFPTTLEYTMCCQKFFIEQLKIMQPRLLLVLGIHAMNFLVHLSDDLEHVWLNKKSKLKGLPDMDAENKSLVKNVFFRGFHNPITIIPLTHPSYYKRWVGRRRHGDLTGSEAETAMLKKACELASIKLEIK